jgi:hypothetical protein
MFFGFPGRGVFVIFGVTKPSVMFFGFPSGAVSVIFGVVMRSVMFFGVVITVTGLIVSDSDDGQAGVVTRVVSANFGFTMRSVMFSGFPSRVVFANFGVTMRSVMFSGEIITVTGLIVTVTSDDPVTVVPDDQGCWSDTPPTAIA